ncbi:MAG: IclR family transcriptional regulator [Rubrobacteraceae bacterium]
MNPVTSKSSSVQSVDRAITVMELLSSQGWSGVTEVANELNIHKSTAYRLLATLRDRGLVEQDNATEKYRLGFGVVLLASTVTADLDIVRYARPICERLSDELEETVTVTALEGAEAVIIHQSISTSSMMAVDWSGWHSPLHASAAGKVLLAYMPEERRQHILRKPLESLTENTVTDRAVLQAQLQEIREIGYGYIDEELEVGMTAVGAPIQTADGKVIAAVAVSGPVFRLPAEQVPETAELVKQAAEEISRSLGFYGDPPGSGDSSDG